MDGICQDLSRNVVVVPIRIRIIDEIQNNYRYHFEFGWYYWYRYSIHKLYIKPIGLALPLQDLLLLCNKSQFSVKSEDILLLLELGLLEHY